MCSVCILNYDHYKIAVVPVILDGPQSVDESAGTVNVCVVLGSLISSNFFLFSLSTRGGTGKYILLPSNHGYVCSVTSLEAMYVSQKKLCKNTYYA